MPDPIGATTRTAMDNLRVLEVILTGGCNLRCAYCYQNDKKPRSMSWETLRGALDLALGSRSPTFEILFLGGEPLLEFPLIRRAVAYVEAARASDKTVGYSIVTNGTLLRDEQAAFLAEHWFDTHLSFDGVPAVQDTRGPGTFPILDALLDRLRRRYRKFYRERLSISMTITPSGVPLLAESIAYFLRKRVRTIAASPVITHDPSWTLDKIRLLEQAFDGVLDVSIRHYKRTGEVPFEVLQKGGGPAEGEAPNRHHSAHDVMCAAPTGQNLAIDVDGQVHGCAVFVESYQGFASAVQRDRVEALRMGDFRDPDFPRRLAMYPEVAHRLQVFHAKHEKYSSYGRCGECRFLDECSICPASIGNIPGNTDPRRVPDFACAYNLVALAARAKFPAPPSALEILTGAARAYGPLGRVQRRMLAAIGRAAPPSR